LIRHNFILVGDKDGFYDSLFLAAAEARQVSILMLDRKLYETG